MFETAPVGRLFRGILKRLPLVFGILVVSVLFVSNQSWADPEGDVTVSANVIESSPTDLPTTTTAELGTGEVITDAPVTITLTGLEPFSLVQIFAQSDPILIASGYADKYGIFEVVAKLPPTLEAGAHSVVASAQKRGESAPTLVSLVKFTVSSSGRITNKSSNKPAIDSTSMPSVTAAPEQELVEGVLFVGALNLDAQPTFHWDGGTGKFNATVMNAYKKPYTLTVNVTVKALGLFPIGEVKRFSVTKLKDHEARTLSYELAGLGQWGIYSLDVEVIPPVKLDDLTLPRVHRQALFFVLPLIPLFVLLALVFIELLRRTLVMPYLKGRKLLANLMHDDEARLES
mgnify:CR=1 FL=1